MTRPRIAADVAAALTAAIPPRLIKKLDAEPTLADRWTWSATAVVTDKNETVSLTLTGEVITGVACSCLLQPKCLHIAAVVTLLEPDASTAGAAAPAAAAAAPQEALVVDVAAARSAFAALGAVLAAGAESSGAFAQAELLRSIHACRTAGLHRLATAQTRALRSIRELRTDRSEFSLPILTADLRDGLAVAHALAHGTAAPTAALVGTARREYEDAGNLRVRGVLCEAVVARSGYAGCTTYLIDDRGQLYTRSDVAPGDAGRAAGAYDASAAIGDAVLPHRELCRSGLFVSDATASADGRLGAGQKVRAVRSSEPSRWDGDHLAPKFKRPLAEQLAHIAALDAGPDELRPAGWDFLYVEGTLVGGPGGVGIVAGETPIRFTTMLEHKALTARDNLVVLSRASGLAVRAIGRCRIGVPRELELLAIGPAPGETRFTMPDAWHGRANLHYDRLSQMRLGDAPDLTVAAPLPHDDLLGPLRRRVERAVLGGAGTLPTHAIAELEREAAALAERALHGGAEVLRDLAALAHDAARAATGMRRPLDRNAFAAAWLRAALYEDSARRRLSVASW
ncbi:MAG: hypothetical protein KF773_02170 [Deltaproteobacteria bacterium]|nr:hypothetical protein [Deltaproteobacteria bacterium]